MIRAMGPRRRAHEFARLLDDPTRQGADTQGADAQYAELLELVGDLRSVAAPTPRPEFVSDLRERLMAEADTVLLPREAALEDRLRLPERTVTARPNRRLATAAGAIAMVGASTSMAVAAQTTLPGDTLYPIKRALESAQAGATLNDVSAALTKMSNASARLDEASQLASRGGSAELSAIEASLAEFIEQTEGAVETIFADFASSGETANIQKVRDFSATSMHRVELLGSILPPEGVEGLLEVARSLSAIDARAAELCAVCDGGVTQIPQVLLAGGQVAPAMEAITPAPESATEPDQGEAPAAEDIDLPDLPAPVTDGASGISGLPDAAPAPALPDASEETRPTRPGSKTRKRVENTLENLTKGLVGDASTEGPDGLVPGLVDGVTDTLDQTVGAVTGTLGGLLGGTAPTQPADD